MLDMHHIISDGVSMDILVKEFVTLYEGKRFLKSKFNTRILLRGRKKFVQ